jgi:hypothetical protein
MGSYKDGLEKKYYMEAYNKSHDMFPYFMSKPVFVVWMINVTSKNV